MSSFQMKDVRGELERLMRSTLADRRNWTYEFVRPLPVPTTWHPGQHVVADCSHGVKLLCRWAGAPDPMGTNYGPWGNSTTLCAHLQHLAYAHELKVGDIVTFGPGGDQHAAMVLETGNDPLLWSFGHQGAPDTYRVSQDSRPHQYLRNPVPFYRPTHDDILRSKTGFWSWLQWRLGEGAWRYKGQANPTVRPDVPKLIPLAWWRLAAQFLRARKKGNKPTT